MILNSLELHSAHRVYIKRLNTKEYCKSLGRPKEGIKMIKNKTTIFFPGQRTQKEVI